MKCGVLELLRHEVQAVKLAGDMRDADLLVRLRLAHLVLAKIQVLDPLGGECSGPIDAGFAVGENGGALDRIVDGKIFGVVFERQKFLNAFVGCDDLSFRRALRRLLLSDAAPHQGATTP